MIVTPARAVEREALSDPVTFAGKVGRDKGGVGV
jgi:hypothetical protein